MKHFLLATYQFPQILLSLILIRILRAVKFRMENNIGVYTHDRPGLSSFSLGPYVFIRNDCRDNNAVLAHERGHSRQSRLLGPLYLIFIGLPSIAGNVLARFFPWFHKHYYKLPWEAWADRLGQVDRTV
jgi:hypothetical protein